MSSSISDDLRLKVILFIVTVNILKQFVDFFLQSLSEVLASLGGIVGQGSSSMRLTLLLNDIKMRLKHFTLYHASFPHLFNLLANAFFIHLSRALKIWSLFLLFPVVLVVMFKIQN